MFPEKRPFVAVSNDPMAVNEQADGRRSGMRPGRWEPSGRPEDFGMLLGPMRNRDCMDEPEKVEVLSADSLYAGLQFDEHRTLFDYWRRIRGQHQMPARADFDPVDVPRLLSHIGLVDVVQPGPRFRYRVVGTALASQFSQSQDGRFVDEATTADYGAYLLRIFSLPYRLRAPVYITERTRYALGYEKLFGRLMLPMGQDRQTPDMILCSTMADDPEPLDGEDPLVDPRSAVALEVLSLGAT